MSDIRIVPTEELPKLVRLVADAYPGMKVVSEEDHRKYLERVNKMALDPRSSSWGLYRENKMIGTMRLINYTMSLFGRGVATGGLSMVAVDLLHKKEAVAKELVEFYLNYYRERSAAWTILWPFRPDFYYDMGFGYGGKIHLYHIKPADLPKGPSKKHVRAIGLDEIGRLLECYNRYYPTANGLVDESEVNFRNRLEFYPELHFTGVEIGGRLEAYFGWAFESAHSDNHMVNNIRGIDLVYHTREALSELCTYLRSQLDQIKEVIIRTYDPDFHFLSADPRDGSDHLLGPIYHQSHQTGVGAMYRVINLEQALQECTHHNFNGVNCRLKLNVRDTFLPVNDSSTVAVFENGTLTVDRTAKHDVEVTLNVADFSSLLLGGVRFRSLYDYGKAEISDVNKIQAVDRLFLTDRPPACLTRF